MFDYTILKNELFYVNEGRSIIKEVDNYKILLVLDFLQKYTNRMETIGFSLEKLITYYGYKVSTKKGEIIDQMKHIFKFLYDKKIIEFIGKIDIDKIKSNQYIECKLNNKCEHGFIQLFEKEMKAILNYNKVKVDKTQLLTLYCYLKSRIYKHQKGDNVVKDGGRAETCYATYETINKDIGLSKTAATKYVDILVELNLIRYKNAGLWYYATSKEIKRESPNLYCLYQSDEEYCKANLKQGIKQYRNSENNKGKIWTDSREYKHNNRQLNGEKGAIIKKINKGTAIESDKIRLKAINNLINNEIDETVRLNALFKEINEKVGEVTLSEYYYDFKDKESDKYYNLEKSLGLLDAEDNLTVDYEYYKWIMVNCDKNKHDYYVNCVKKHIKKQNNKDNSLQGNISKELDEDIWGEENLIDNKTKATKIPFGGFYKELSRNKNIDNPF